MSALAHAVDFNISPFVVIWENTRACDLACVHCRAAAQPKRNRFELTTEEGFHLIDQIAELHPKVFVLTGGDPLKREDTYELIQYARAKGLEPSLTPSATPLLTEEAVTKMKQHGLGRMAVSLDASNAAEHDAFRRVEGELRSRNGLRQQNGVQREHRRSQDRRLNPTALRGIDQSGGQ